MKIYEALISNRDYTKMISLVKNYWEKRFKKELMEEEDKLKQEIAAAVKKKLDESSESDPDS